MYDLLEVEISYEYLNKLIKVCNKLNFGIIGGWAVYYYVNKEYKKAFGVDYLKSRDIDIFIDGKDYLKFLDIINKLGFDKSAYYFRYELIYNRLNKTIINKEQAKKIDIYNLVYVFLDLFSNLKKKQAWYLDILKRPMITEFNNIKLVDIDTLLKLKTYSFFEREKLDKELKDACDIYSLIMYSNYKFNLTRELKKALEKIIKRDDLCDFIAENVLRDNLKSSLVKLSIKNFLKS